VKPSDFNARLRRYRTDFKKAFQQVCKIAGVKATPHDLRHWFASRHAVARTSFQVIAGWLGHSTTWVTQRYAHFQQSYNKAADDGGRVVVLRDRPVEQKLDPTDGAIGT